VRRTPDRISIFFTNDVLVTVYSKDSGKYWDTWLDSRTLHGSSYFKALVDSDFQESQGVQDDLPPLGDGPDDNSGSDSDAEFDEATPSSSRPSAELVMARQPKLHHIRLSNYRFRTVRAILMWMLTGEIVLKPLRSKGVQAASEPLGSSPKLIYRAASYLGVDALQKLAKSNIVSQLNADIAEELLFSPFCQVYTEVR
jgi:hypothetical protein